MTDFTHSLAVVIGIDAYSNGIPRLTTAVNDATRLVERLAARHGYETVLLTGSAADEPVTLARLHHLFTVELPARLGADDRLLVYFAGHGVALDGDDGPRGYLVPQDARPGDSASMLAMTDLNAWLIALPCRHMLAILDCCFAGAFRWSSTRDLGALPEVIHKERYDRYLLSPAWEVLTSAAYDQTALDVLAGDAKRGARLGEDGPHSPFALALLDALAGAGDVVPKGQGDGVITASELFVYLQDAVSRAAEEQANHEQMPGLWPLKKHRKGEYIFLVPGHPLNLPPAPALTDEANPYRGLKSYEQKHAPLFFGREDEIEALVQRVTRQPFIAVLGASGTGKSSLVKAGLLPRLEVRSDDFSRLTSTGATEVATTNESYRVLPPMRPTDRPVQALAGLLPRLEVRSDDFSRLTSAGATEVATTNESYRVLPPMRPTDRPVQALAGLLPRLEVRSDDFSRLTSTGATEVATTNESYRVLPPMRPTDRPVQALAALLRAELGAELPEPGGPTTLDGDDALAQAVARWAAAHPDQRLVLTIDQFEELVTLCRDDDEREHFLVLLATAVKERPDAFRLIITLRTDFEPQFTQPGSLLAEAWPEARYVVPALDIDDLRQVIEGPASVRVLYFDPPELVDSLIKEVIQTPGALPLLSFTLSELYVKYVQSGRDDRALSGQDYAALGGVVGSLRNRATEEYDALPDDAHRQTMQRVMLRLVAVEGGELARRRATLSELDYPTAAENARVQAVLDRLVAARLLVRGAADPSIGSGQAPNDAPGEAYVEPAHDALVLAWDRLLRWRKAAGEYLPLQRRLAQAANDWSRAAPEARPGLLWDNDPRLPQVEETLWPTGGRQKGLVGRSRGALHVLAPHTDRPTDTAWLNKAELTFVQASVEARTRFWRRAVGVALLLALVLIGATAISLSLRGRALQAEATAVAEAQRAVNAQGTAVAEATRALNAESTAVANEQTARDQARRARAGELSAVALGQIGHDPERALLIAQEAVSVTRTFESEEALRETLRGSQLRAAYAPEADWVDSVAYAPDGSRLLATGTHRGQPFAQVLELPTLTPTVRLSDLPGGYITGAVFSPDGQQILTSDDSGVVSLWDARTGLADPPFQGIAADWSADGQYFVVAVEDGTVDIRRTVDGRGARTFPGRDGDSAAAVYFAAGDRLIVLVTAADTGNDQQARVLDAATGDVLAEFPVNYDSLAFTADRMALAYGDGETVQVRSASDNFVQPVFSLPGHTADVTATRFSPDDRLVASTATDNTVRVWTLDALDRPPARAFVARSTTLEQSAVRIAFSPLDGTLLAAGYGDVRGWDIANTRELFSVDHSSGQEVDALAAAPDGRTFATISAGSVRLWASRPGEEYVLYGPGEAVMAPDGRRLALTASDGIRLQGAGPIDPTALRLPGWEAGAYRDVAFTANGRYLYAQQGSRVAWWDVASGEGAGALDLDGKANGDITLAPDGTVVGGSLRLDGRETRLVPVLLDAATGQPRPLAGEMPPYQAITQLFFSPDGSLFFVNGSTFTSEAGSNRVVRVWDTATGDLVLPAMTATREAERFPVDGGFGRGASFIFAPDGQRLIMANERGIVVWRVADGMRLKEIPAGAVPISALAMALSQDGTRLVLPDGFTTTGRIWDLNTGQATALRGHAGVISEVQISADGSLVLTASGQDGTTRLWDGVTGELLTVFPWVAQGVDLSPDGRLLLASPGVTARGVSYPQLILTRPADLLALSRTRVTRTLTCTERRDYLRDAIDCPVVTPEPVAS